MFRLQNTAMSKLKVIEVGWIKNCIDCITLGCYKNELENSKEENK